VLRSIVSAENGDNERRWCKPMNKEVGFESQIAADAEFARLMQNCP
jgi:hypothetical protein